MNESPHIPLSDEILDEAERRALIAAVEQSRADPSPDIPNEVVEAEMDAEIEALERRIAAAFPPAA